MPERDELDRLIDSELARYAEPRAGLEQRVLARVEAAAVRRPGRLSEWQRWIGVGAAVTLAAVLFAWIPRFMHRATDRTTAHITSPDFAPTAVPGTAVPHRQLHIAPLRHKMNDTQTSVRNFKAIDATEHSDKPKLDVFPAPQPLSAQEQSMIEFAKQLPDAERERLISDQRENERLLEISSIRISPITMPDLGKN
jgi:hypothetical protein